MEFLIRMNDDELDVRAPMPPGRRIFLLLVALVPCFAQYQLLIRPRWESIANVCFLFAAVISIGAMAVSALHLLAAAAGMDSRMTFSRTQGVFTHSTRAPLMPRRTRKYRIDSIAGLEVGTRGWGEGSPSYSFDIVLRNRERLRLGSASSRSEAEAVRNRVEEFLSS